MPDLDDVFSATDPQTVVIVAIAGLAIGLIVLHEVPTAHGAGFRAIAVAFLGLAFLVPIGVSRFVAGSTLWPGWIGTCLLWLLFTAGIWAGVRSGAWFRT